MFATFFYVFLAKFHLFRTGESRESCHPAPESPPRASCAGAHAPPTAWEIGWLEMAKRMVGMIMNDEY